MGIRMKDDIYPVWRDIDNQMDNWESIGIEG
jgi:hypothetical protein